MWWKPTYDAFILTNNPIVPISGLGRLSQNKLTEFDFCVSALLERVTLFIQNMPPEGVPRVLGPTVQMLKHGLSRIQSLAMAFRQLELQVCGVQRFWLEIVAMVDYMEIYRPRMDASQGTINVDPPSVADTIGIFTSDVRVVQDHFQSGLPYWFIRPASALDNQNILKTCQPELPYNLQVELHPFRSRVLAEGRAGTNEKFNAIHKYARNIMKYANPFDLGTTVNINAVVPQVLRSPSSELSPGPTRTQHQRNQGSRKEVRGTKTGDSGSRGKRGEIVWTFS